MIVACLYQSCQSVDIATDGLQLSFRYENGTLTELYFKCHSNAVF